MVGYKNVSLVRLKVNPQNPRYRDPRLSEADAVLALFRETKGSTQTSSRIMLNLVADIVEHGTNPAELPIVVPDPSARSAYQVMEGNRRIASLKLLYLPELANQVFEAGSSVLVRLGELRTRFQERHGDRYKKVLCVVYSSAEETQYWAYLRHTGENEGRGVTRWDKASIDRFRLQQREAKYTIGTQVVEVLIEEGYLKGSDDVVLSTVERMVRDPDVCSRLGIEIIDDKVVLPSNSQQRGVALDALARIAFDTVEKDPQTRRRKLTSRRIDRKEQRHEYLDGIIMGLSPSPAAQSEPARETSLTANRLSPMDGSAEEAALPVASGVASRPRAAQDYKKRRQIAAKGINVSESRLQHLYEELTRLDADQYPNVGMMGIRAFLEGSLDMFIEQFPEEQQFVGWKANRSAPFSIALTNKLAKVIDLLEEHKALGSDSAQSIRKYQSDKDNPLSVDTLQAYLHNPQFDPRGNNVRFMWDAYHPLLEALWDTYDKATKG